MSGTERAVAGVQAVGNLGQQVMKTVGELAAAADGAIENERRDVRVGAPDSAPRMAPARVDGAAHSIQEDFRQRLGPSMRPTAEDDLRAGLIGQIHRFPDLLMSFVNLGIEQALAELSPPPRSPSRPDIGELLCLAASIAIGGGAATIAATLTAKLVGEAAKRPIEYGLREAIKHGLRSKAAAAPVDGRVDLLPAFRAQLHAQQMRARTALDAEFAALHISLAGQTTDHLATLAEALTSRATTAASAVHEDVANQTVVAWTNFLAQLHHGAMGEWDLWADQGSTGAVALRGAAAKPGTTAAARDATAGNVAPGAARQLETAGASEHVGILEIALDLHGGLLTDGRGRNYGPGYGMRLENVGPGARARIQQLGRVRDAHINKLIRFYEVTDRDVSPLGNLMITADGYVRYYDLGGETRVHPDHQPLSLKESLGIEHRRFRTNTAANERVCRELAERAQDLPLSRLES